MDILPILLIIIITSWALTAFQKKILLRNFNFLELGLGNFVVIFILISSFYLFLVLSGNFDTTKLLNATREEQGRFFLCGILIFAGGLAMNYVLTNNDATKIIPMVKAGIIISTLVLGCLFYSEQITFKKVLASGFAIIAIIILFDEKSNTPK